MNTQIAEATRRRAENSDWPPEASLCALVRSNFSPDYFSRDNLLMWLSLWGEIAVNPKLRAAHRELYEAYRAELAEEIAAVAAPRGKRTDAPALARNFIALVDGLWLEWCLDETIVTPQTAEAAAFEMLEAQVGPLRGQSRRPQLIPRPASIATQFSLNGSSRSWADPARAVSKT